MKRLRLPIIAGFVLAVATLCLGTGRSWAVYGPNSLVNYNVPNFANSPNLTKFVDSLPGLGAAGANNLGQYIPVAIPDTTSYPGNDYYEIELGQFTEKMHTDLPPTTLRGYRQTNTTDPTVSQFHYLGPIIVATAGRPVRIKFTNSLPHTGAGGDLFLPVDTTIMGAGMGPMGGMETYTQNRATLHLHGGNTPWISDGTPHQWITPAGEATSYPTGVSVQNVPDMPVPPSGSATFYYPNQQSGRFMFYHDHAYGITRFNVYAGEAAGYLLQDPAGTGEWTLPTSALNQIPLVIQDKGFVNVGAPAPAGFTGKATSPTSATDPSWALGGAGSLWFPHVYVPNQDPTSMDGMNPFGRWDYGPWFWPPSPYTTVLPAFTSAVPEAFMDTPVVNGTAYPYITVQPQAYRFRILNACNDRMLNLQLYKASSIVGGVTVLSGGSGYTAAPGVTITPAAGDTTGHGAVGTATINPATGAVTAVNLACVGSGYTLPPTVTIAPPTGLGGTTATASANLYTGLTEVGMVPADPGTWPAGWPTPDGRAGGFPDPAEAGPAMVQIGTEGGLLPAPAVINNVPVGYDYNRRSITVLNVLEHSLYMGPAERADVVIDFSQYAGQTLLLYNDAPAPVPAFDPRYDYYTADPDQTANGGAPSTVPGYGPNTRTIMQIRVAGTPGTTPPPTNYYDPALLALLQTALPSAFAATQPPLIAPPGVYSRIQDTSINLGAPTSVASVIVTTGGTGFSTPPTVSFIGGGGTGAQATATITGSPLTSVTLTNGGSGYKKAPAVSFAGGGGTGAAATATVTNGVVTALTLTNRGTGYTSAPTVVFSGGNPKVTATATAYTVGGRVTAITVANGGTGYTFAPAVAVTGGGGSGVAAVASLTGAVVMLPKAIVEGFDTVYGRMNATLGVEQPFTTVLLQTTIPYFYVDPPTEAPKDGETQIWKITHNGVDTHAIHFHQFDAQLVNRVGWDGAIKPPDANEMGWKDTIRMNPLEDIIVAVKPMKQTLPFDLPNSIRPLDVTAPLGSTTQFTGVDVTNQPAPVTNSLVNFGWEYVWHCHLLGHEENDMMRPIAMAVNPVSPTIGTATLTGSGTTQTVALTWKDNSKNETAFTIQRAATTAGPWTTVATVQSTTGPATGAVMTFTDAAPPRKSTFVYQVIANNVVGYTQTYPAPAGGYPQTTASSAPSAASNAVTTN